MSSIKNQLSTKSKYFLEKDRYLELVHFCKQYKTWKKAYDSMLVLSGKPTDEVNCIFHEVNNPTERIAMNKVYYKTRMDMIENAAKNTDEYLWSYIFKAVTEGLSYNHLSTKYGIPCCRDVYYDAYRRFFWILSKSRE